MSGLLQRIQARREKRKARRRARFADKYTGDVDKFAVEAQQRRYKAESPPYGGGGGTL